MRHFRCVIWVVLASSTVVHSQPIIKGPYVQNVTTDAITVMWEAEVKEGSTVEYGLKGSFDREASDPFPVKIYKVRLRDLKPATEYSYRVGDRVGHFKTAPPAGTPFEFAVFRRYPNLGQR